MPAFLYLNPAAVHLNPNTAAPPYHDCMVSAAAADNYVALSGHMPNHLL